MKFLKSETDTESSQKVPVRHIGVLEGEEVLLEEMGLQEFSEDTPLL